MKTTSCDTGKRYTVVVVAWGDALFTQVGTNADPVSYMLPPPSAAAGILRSIFWKPAFDFNVRKIELLGYGHVETYTVKGVSEKLRTKQSKSKSESKSKSNAILQTRSYVRSLRVRITADIAMLSLETVRKLNPGYIDDGRENAKSYYIQFKRSCMRGRHFKQPNFGQANMPCSYAWAKHSKDVRNAFADEKPVSVSASISGMPVYRNMASRLGHLDGDDCLHYETSTLLVEDGIMTIPSSCSPVTKVGTYRV